jgi:hypothetical protein
MVNDREDQGEKIISERDGQRWSNKGAGARAGDQ